MNIINNIVHKLFYTSTNNNHKSLQVTILGRDTTYETIAFPNHTECHCTNRSAARINLTTSTRWTRNPTPVASQTIPIINDTKCACAPHFTVVETNNDSDGKKRCRCDCNGNNTVNCIGLTEGLEGFGINDRRYVRIWIGILN